MLFSSSTTFLLITRDRIARAEFARGAGGPKRFFMRERPEVDDMGELVAESLELDTRKAGRTVVLSSDFWTHTLEVPTSNTPNLPDEELRQMLNFEAEPLSNISPFEATIASIPLGGDSAIRRYWVTQVPTHIRDQIDEVVRKAGGRLIGLAHPRETTAESNVDGDSFRAPADEAGLRVWLTKWNDIVQAKDRPVPFITAAPRTLTQQQANRIALVLAGVALAGCLGHYYWTNSRIEAATAEQKIWLKPTGQLTQVKQQVTQIEKDLKSEGEAREKLSADVTETEKALASQRHRLVVLLQELTGNSNEHWVLQKMDGDGRRLTLSGTTMHPEHMADLASALSRKLSPLDWSVELVEQHAQDINAEGGPWSFDLHVRDLQPVKVVEKPVLGKAASRTKLVRPEESKSP